MTKQTKELEHHRYQFVHGNDGDFVAYQRNVGDGVWHTFSTWMIPRTNNS